MRKFECVQERITNKKVKIHREQQLILLKLLKLVKTAFCSS